MPEPRRVVALHFLAGAFRAVAEDNTLWTLRIIDENNSHWMQMPSLPPGEAPDA